MEITQRPHDGRLELEPLRRSTKLCLIAMKFSTTRNTSSIRSMWDKRRIAGVAPRRDVIGGSIRGLKPTATVMRSLRDHTAGQALKRRTLAWKPFAALCHCAFALSLLLNG
jgi:hypothetical protein